MANYSTLKAAVANVVKTNGTRAITGANLQSVLLSIINSIGGGGYIFKGVATPSTSAGTPDENVFYIGGAGTYANFGTSVTVPVGSIGVFKYNGSWTKEQIALFAGIDDEPTAGSDNLVKSGGVYDEIVNIVGIASYSEASVSGWKTYCIFLGKKNVRYIFTINIDAVPSIRYFGIGSYNLGNDIVSKTIPANSSSYSFEYTPSADTEIYVNSVGSMTNVVVTIETYGENVHTLEQRVTSLEDVASSYIDNQEFLRVYTDANGIFLFGIKKDGSVEWAKGVPQPIIDYVNSIFTPEQANNIANLVSTYYILDDPENRLEMLLDTENRIIAYRKPDGTMVENKGIETKNLKLSKEGIVSLAEDLKEGGFAGTMDWSNEQFVQIPIPRTCAVINFETNSQATTKADDIETYMQYWDKDGNYFRKPIILNAQGASSMSYAIKNQSIDLDDGSEVKFGDWCPFDSYHLKKDFIDVFRGQRVVTYHFAEQVFQSRPFGERRPWNYIDANNSYSNGLGTFSRDFDSGALAHPDGFPVKVYFNGVNAGVYSLNIKKSRNNYNCKKNNQNQIILDGVLGDVFWMANGNLSQTGVTGSSIWEDFEIRNPKISTDIDGNPYDGDHPKEPANTYATCKAAIARLTTALTNVNNAVGSEAKRSKFEEFFNVPFLIDYDIISNVIYHFDGYIKNWIWLTNDGILWSPTLYDTDSVFGQYWDGTRYVSASTTTILGTSNSIPTGNSQLKALYTTEIEARYKELRDAGIISVDNIIRLLTNWLDCIGYDNLMEDIEKIVVSSYYENGAIVVDGEGKPVKIPNTPSYRDGTKTYSQAPTTGGWYNSIERVKNWLTARIAKLDMYYNY